MSRALLTGGLAAVAASGAAVTIGDSASGPFERFVLGDATNRAVLILPRSGADDRQWEHDAATGTVRMHDRATGNTITIIQEPVPGNQ